MNKSWKLWWLFVAVFVQLLSPFFLWHHGLQHARHFCPPVSPSICSNSCPLSWWCYLTILSSITSFNLSQHQGLFQWVSSSHQLAKVLVLQQQSFQWIFRVDFFYDWLVWSCNPRDSRDSSSTRIWKHQFFSTQPSLWSNSHIRTCDYWKNHSFNYMDLYWQSDVCAF